MPRFDAAIAVWLGLVAVASMNCAEPDDATPSEDGECKPLVVSDPPPSPQGPHLIDNTSWTLTPSNEDPWSAVAPDKVRCEENALVVEALGGDETWFSINTQDCGYATVSQPLQRDIAACTDLLVHLWAFKFVPPKLSEGTGYEVVVSIGDPLTAGGEPLVRLRGDALPDESQLFYEVVRTSRSYSKGEPVYYHVSNHGQNSWEFIQLRAID